MARDFDTRAYIASLDVASNVGLYARPGVVPLDECESAVASRVAGEDGVVTGVKNFGAKGCGDKEAASVEDHAVLCREV